MFSKTWETSNGKTSIMESIIAVRPNKELQAITVRFGGKKVVLTVQFEDHIQYCVLRVL